MVSPAQATTIAASATGNDHKAKYALAVSLVVTDLIKAYDAGDTLNFTKLKGTAAKKYKLQGIPKLADILQALPISYRAKLLPFLQTKPVRSASGVAVVGALIHTPFHVVEVKQQHSNSNSPLQYCTICCVDFLIIFCYLTFIYSCNEQTTPLPSHCIHRKCLCLLSGRARFRFRILHSSLHWVRTDFYAGNPSTL